MLSDRQDRKLSDVGLILQLRHNGTEIQRSQCMWHGIVLRLQLEQP